MMLVDESRVTFGITAELRLLAGSDEITTPAAFLSRILGLRTLDESLRRAMVRRIATTRPEIAPPSFVRSAPAFARLALEAIDRGETDPPFGPLAAQYRTLVAFANALDVGEGLRRALSLPLVPLAGAETLQIDARLLADESRAFGLRRIAALLERELTPVEIEIEIAEPLVDRLTAAGVAAWMRFAQTESDDDARIAIRSKCAPLSPDDAGLILATTGERASVLEAIESGAAGAGRDAATALRSMVHAYRVPDLDAAQFLATTVRILGIDSATAGALERIARDFDAARILAPAWSANELIAEFEAELASLPPLPFTTAFAGAPLSLRSNEPVAPVPARRDAPFSASSLNTFAECARKWYFRYICAAVQDPGSSASFYGIAFHAALEDFHIAHAEVDPNAGAELGDVLDYHIVAAFDRHRTRFDAPVEFELQKRRARRTAKRYLAWLIERARRSPFTVIGCEESMTVELDGMPFVGIIDRLDRNTATGEVTVVDYKTGAIAVSADDYLEDVRAFREFQLPFYYWARTQAGDRVSQLALVPLKDALLEVVPIELNVVVGSAKPRGRRSDATTGTIGVADLETAKKRMVSMATILSAGSLVAYPATDNPDACRYCAYYDACTERPLRGGERFGR